MPTVNTALSGFEGYLSRARSGRDALMKERDALGAEALRIEREVTERFFATLTDRFPKADALLRFDANSGNRMRLSDRLRSMERQAERAKEEMHAHGSRVVAGASAEDVERAKETLARARFAWDDAARANDRAGKVVREFDMQFVRAHNAVTDAGLGDDAIKGSSFLSRAFNSKLREAVKAIERFEKSTGTSYWSVRDDEFLPAVALSEGTQAHEASTWKVLQDGDAEVGLLRKSRERVEGHDVRKAELANAYEAATAAVRSPSASLRRHAATWLNATLMDLVDEASSGKPGLASMTMERLASDGLVGSGDLALVGHAISLRRTAEGLSKPIMDMNGLVSKLMKGKDDLQRAKNKGAGSKQVKIDLSAIEKAVKGGGGKIDDVLVDLGHARSAYSARTAARRGEDRPYDSGSDLMFLLWIQQVAVATTLSGADVSPRGLDDGSLSGLGAAQGITVAGLDVPNVSVDVPSINVEIPNITVDIPTITVDVPSYTPMDTNY